MAAVIGFFFELSFVTPWASFRRFFVKVSRKTLKQRENRDTLNKFLAIFRQGIAKVISNVRKRKDFDSGRCDGHHDTEIWADRG